MPKGKHSALQGELVAAINATVKPQRVARAFPELRCTFGSRSTVPDIAIFTWERIPRDADGEIADTFSLAPDWTIEILSPEQSQTKVTKNILRCLKHGTQMGWLIDPSEATVFAYRSECETEVFDSPNAVLPVPEFANPFHLTRPLAKLCLAHFSRHYSALKPKQAHSCRVLQSSYNAAQNDDGDCGSAAVGF